MTWSEASREASARTEATLRSAASRISRTWSEVDAANDGAGERRVGLERVRDPAQMLVHCGWVVAPAPRREVAALDSVPIHDRSG